MWRGFGYGGLSVERVNGEARGGLCVGGWGQQKGEGLLQEGSVVKVRLIQDRRAFTAQITPPPALSPSSLLPLIRPGVNPLSRRPINHPHLFHLSHPPSETAAFPEGRAPRDQINRRDCIEKKRVIAPASDKTTLNARPDPDLCSPASPDRAFFIS